jgi:hypothetical protein
MAYRFDDDAYLDHLNTVIQANATGLVRVYKLARVWWEYRPLGVLGEPEVFFQEMGGREAIGAYLGIPYPEGGPEDVPSIWSEIEDIVQVAMDAAREGFAIEEIDFVPELW